MESNKAALIILDGWGIGPNDTSINAIAAAKTPYLDSLFKKYPHTTLLTSGEDVGLPEGQMGNSEVGHMNLGAGRVVYQQLVIINKAFRQQEVAHNPVLQDAINYLKSTGRKLHLLGLVSDGGVHASMDHLKGLCSIAAKNSLEKVYIHAFTDGRDTDPHSGLNYISDLQKHLGATTGQIASITGRYYAMDRDKRWERVKMAYDNLVHGEGEAFKDPLKAIKASYDNNISDEFIKPAVITDDKGAPLATIEAGDVVLFFNFRTDRGRQLTRALSQEAFPEFDMKPLDLYYITMTEYDDTFRNVKILFPELDLRMTMGEVVEAAGRTQLRMAETEKYPHVTFFFSGGREEPFKGEARIMVPSPKVATYDLQPAMSAVELANKAAEAINTGKYDMLVLNFANPDMVGHTGVFPAVVEAVETVDKCTRTVVDACLANGFDIIIIADHGNADYLVNPDGTPNTAHTTNPVPMILVSNKEGMTLSPGRLADIAPTMLKLMDIPIPEEMGGNILVTHK